MCILYVCVLHICINVYYICVCVYYMCMVDVDVCVCYICVCVYYMYVHGGCRCMCVLYVCAWWMQIYKASLSNLTTGRISGPRCPEQRPSHPGEQHVCAWGGWSGSMFSGGDYKKRKEQKRKEGAQMKSFSAAWPFEASDFLVSCIKHGGLPLNPPRTEPDKQTPKDGLLKDYEVRAKTAHDHRIIRPTFQELSVLCAEAEVEFAF